MKLHTLLGLALALALAVAQPARAQQSNNTGLPAVPVPKKVVIDGKLDDWVLYGQTDVYTNFNQAARRGGLGEPGLGGLFLTRRFGYNPALCGIACQRACLSRLEKRGVLHNQFANPFRGD